ncbi:MAG TPA: CDP-diacylglycerol--glycerol-3-phosphate 3-phosphatidyltransferase [Bryobacteraceae bacterium]|jgi:CDP-diacylglycerol--glycerol-3-phosphate 3-phosphatidyltransferase|nr:CDP-diacylglycerol--glycerol-3-phosphate 3-phosphatidyltransferase [Bryobacteraceae bacterium]
MNLPNALTLTRIFLVPLLVWALVERTLRLAIHGKLLIASDFFALTVFLACAVTDLLDGYLARRWGQVTTVGTLLDPIADKLLISAALVSLVEIRLLPGWMAIVIIGREFAVSGLRSIAAAEGYTIKASELGKTKMVTQVLGVTLLMLAIRWPAVRWWGLLVMWGVVVFAVWSAIDYFRRFWRKVDSSIKLRRRHELLALERQKRRLERAQRSKSGSDAAPSTR